MLRVLAILPRNLAVVSTEGLHRVTAGANSRLVAELVDANTAAELVKAFEAFCPEDGAKATPYASLAPEEPQGPEEGNSDSYSPDVYAILPGCVIVSGRGFHRVVVEPEGTVEWEFFTLEDAENWASKKPSQFWNDKENSVYRTYSYDELALSPKSVEVSPATKAAVA